MLIGVQLRFATFALIVNSEFIKINSQKSNQYDWIDTESRSEAEQNESTASPDCPQGRLTHVFVLYVGFCGKLSKP